MDTSSPRRTRRHRLMAVGAAVTAALALGGGAAVAAAAHGPAEPPRSGSAIPNLDTVKGRIEAYYGDHLDPDGLHQASQDSRWARDVNQVDAHALDYLKHRVDRGTHKPALVLDIDDTSLSTYPFGANRDFAMHNTAADLAAAAQFALAEKLPAIPATLSLARWAHDHGIALFFVSDRPALLRDASAGNLRKAGYPTPDGLFLPPGPDEPADRFKSGKRADIEALGYDVLADIGDQASDLRGGHTDAVFQLPNPLYITP